MVRYMVFFNYYGPGYLGVQSLSKFPGKTVSSIFEEALITARNVIDPNLSIEKIKYTLASRTDRNVHALCNAIHVDFDSPVFENVDPDELTYQMNSALDNLEEKISVLKSIKVPSTFSARHHAVSRTYIYKMCIPNLKKTEIEDKKFLRMTPTFPLFESNRCMFVRRYVDMDLMNKAVQIMSGTRDFRAFTTSHKRREIEMEAEVTKIIKSVKNMEIQIYNTNQFADPNISPLYKDSYQMWNVAFKSSSYIYRQIRKMMCVILDVGFGNMPLSDLEKLFDEKSNFSINSSPSQHMEVHGSAPLLTPDSSSISSSANYSNLSSVPLVAESSQQRIPALVCPPVFKFTVPPAGLYLAHIEYPKAIMDGTATETNDWKGTLGTLYNTSEGSSVDNSEDDSEDNSEEID